ncbi:hypothetical protein H112_05776 [Trichophyton rubrum D6]|uniref:Uncharacterized protein n=2 Tax=Trichophyton TaxID=5550 RepID=A0A080WIM8_TRIRC|nr:uncharacterized protein TERG_12005 [Trichophyton rubrum CBS 118892]EZF72083.1 hypothetical protein H105_05802 [Trichophyton soudanense CBS 452.61]EZF93664.1 hypothetical protein H113_05830 [Trichophyton rubrum MR1459]EZG04744.1 hypothetical protein H106_05625 [Trichophyton rubrum CBS 735.88]EZG15279.1 hypothetical protein H107_05924 [Trichophyton rubrum CBS 202.88]KDB32199.1 hypothetical protein H112_05776 [Trichophyton rubrum D6]
MYTLFFHDNYDYCDNGYIPNTEQSNSQHSACFYRTEGSDASVPHLRVSGPDETLKDIYELVNSKLSYFSCSFLYALLKYSTRILSSTGRFTLPIERNGNEANKIIYYPVILSQVRETFRCGLPYTKILLNNARDTPKGSTAMKEKKFAAYLIIRSRLLYIYTRLHNERLYRGSPRIHILGPRESQQFNQVVPAAS